MTNADVVHLTPSYFFCDQFLPHSAYIPWNLEVPLPIIPLRCFISTYVVLQ